MEIPETELLTFADEVRLARTIEAGLFAQHCLDTGARPCRATRDELVALVAGGRAAYQEFFMANLRLVAHLAHVWSKRANLPVEDLFQEGCIGLGEAIRRWDHTRGLKFSTLGFRMVDNIVTDAALMRCGELDATRFRARSAFLVRRTQQELEAELGRRVGLAELAAHLGRTVDSLSRTLRTATPTRLGTELTNMASEAQDEQDSGPLPAPVWLVDLPDQERQVLTARFGIGEQRTSRAALAARMRLSETTVRRIEARALARARQLLTSAVA